MHMMAVNKDEERVKSLFDLEDDEDKTDDGENLINPDAPTPSTTCTTATATTDDIDEEFSEGEDDQLKQAVEEYEEKTSDAGKRPLTSSEKARAERNRLKALSLKKSRLLTHPYSGAGSKLHRSEQPKLVDSGGGFFIEEEEEGKEERVIVETPGPILPYDQPTCSMCESRFSDSFLHRTFDCIVCDNCKDTGKDGEHELIAKTEAKTTFILKDFHFDEWEGSKPLRFMTRKNPHNPRGGEMKLYLRLQVEERAMLVWGSEEALLEELEKRDERKVETKVRKYNKKMKQLRMSVRSSLYKKDLSTHTHKYKDEVYHEDKDEYSQTCESCGHINTYEKM